MKRLTTAVALFSIAMASSAAFAQKEGGKAPAKPAAGEGGAAAAPAGGDDNVQYKAKTVYDFDDDSVTGDLQRPDGELVDSVRKVKHSSLIEIRKDFIPEMLKSLEDV